MVQVKAYFPGFRNDFEANPTVPSITKRDSYSQALRWQWLASPSKKTTISAAICRSWYHAEAQINQCKNATGNKHNLKPLGFSGAIICIAVLYLKGRTVLAKRSPHACCASPYGYPYLGHGTWVLDAASATRGMGMLRDTAPGQLRIWWRHPKHTNMMQQWPGTANNDPRAVSLNAYPAKHMLGHIISDGGA